MTQQGSVIATRVLTTDTGEVVSVTIFAPRKSGEEEWSCGFAIAGAGLDIRRDCSGASDALAALLLSIHGVRAHLESAKVGLRWEDGDLGDFGIPRPIPTSYGPAVEARLIKVVNDEVARLSAIKWGR